MTSKLTILRTLIGTILFGLHAYIFLLFTDEWTELEPAWYVPFVGGILFYILVMTYSFLTGRSVKFKVLLSVTGTVWLFPPLLMTYFGIPFHLTAVFAVLYMIAQRPEPTETQTE